MTFMGRLVRCLSTTPSSTSVDSEAMGVGEPLRSRSLAPWELDAARFAWALRIDFFGFRLGGRLSTQSLNPDL